MKKDLKEITDETRRIQVANIREQINILLNDYYNDLKEYHQETAKEIQPRSSKKKLSGEEIYEMTADMEMSNYEDLAYICGVIDGIKLALRKLI